MYDTGIPLFFSRKSVFLKGSSVISEIRANPLRKFEGVALSIVNFEINRPTTPTLLMYHPQNRLSLFGSAVCLVYTRGNNQGKRLHEQSV